MRKLKVLVACEESQAVCKAFRELGHEAYSCDILECSGGHPEWHIQGDCLRIINGHNARKAPFPLFRTCDGKYHTLPNKWDLIIAHPPCTYLTCTGNKWFKPEFRTRFPERLTQREEAVSFFMKFWYADCERIAIENPVGIMSSRFRKPDQYIEPYMFGDAEKKKTGLWLKGIPNLIPTNIVKPCIIQCASGAKEPRWHMETMKLPPKERARQRSKTFPGIAKAMAEQWSKFILESDE